MSHVARAISTWRSLATPSSATEIIDELSGFSSVPTITVATMRQETVGTLLEEATEFRLASVSLAPRLSGLRG